MLATVISTSRRLGVQLPAPLRQRIEEIEAMSAKVPHETEAPLAAALDCIEQGKDPAADKAVVAGVVRYVLGQAGLGRAAAVRAERLSTEALTEHADEVLASWAEVLEPHCAALAEAAEVLPGDALSEPAYLRNRPDLAVAWAAATAATNAIDIAVTGFRQLMLALSMPAPEVLVMLAADRVPDEVRVGIHRDSMHPAWALACEGVEVRFVDSLDEMDQRRQLAEAPQPEPERTATVI